MALILFIFLLAVPLVEIALFITVGNALGLMPTLALVILTALVGSILLRTQGFHTWQRARSALDRGQMPVRELFDGLCLFVSGLLLLTPGFFTDAIGLVLLFPPTRRFLAARLASRLVVVQGGDERASSRSVVIEGEYHEIDPDEDSRS